MSFDDKVIETIEHATVLLRKQLVDFPQLVQELPLENKKDAEYLWHNLELLKTRVEQASAALKERYSLK